MTLEREDTALALWREFMGRGDDAPYTTMPYTDDPVCFFCDAGYTEDHKADCIYLRATKIVAVDEVDELPVDTRRSVKG